MSLLAFHQYAARLRRSIDAGFPASGDERMGEFGHVALELFEFQFNNNEAYRRFCESRGGRPKDIGRWEDIPAIPSSAFKELPLSVLPPDERTSAFHSSGTTLHRHSRHFHSSESLALYEASLASWFAPNLLSAASETAQHRPSALIALTPQFSDAPHSSLVYMFEAIARRWRWDLSEFCGYIGTGGDWELDTGSVAELLLRAQTAGQPVLLLGTAFSFVHLLDSLPDRARNQLPPGSRVMETGGYKGRSRTMPKQALHSALSDRLGLPPANIVSEYGMSELSSQAYDRPCGAPSNNIFRFPPWVRAQVISAETGQPVEDGQTGLLRIFDLANAYSVLAVQTEDLGTRRGDGFDLVGRMPRAEPRGCSLLTA